MGKWIGSLLLIGATAWLCAQWIVSRRRTIALLQDLAAALESMEATIRWQKTPLPKAISDQCGRDHSGCYFRSIQKNLNSNLPLHQVWSEAFADVQPTEAGEILRRLELTGDEVRITGSLHLAAAQLREVAQGYRQRQREQEKLSVAVCVSGVSLLIILLI